MPFDDPQQHSRAAFRLAPPLFPVPKSAYADPHQSRELRLAQAMLLAKTSHIGLCQGEHPRRVSLAPQNLPSLANTLQQLVKEFFLHGYSASTTLRKARR